MPPARSTAILLLSLGVAAGCRKDDKSARDQPAAPSQAVPAATGGTRAQLPPHEHMQQHFDAIISVRDALIAGDVDFAQAEARWIVEHDVEPTIASWKEYLVDMRQWAAQVVEATEVGPASAAAAELARACGRCHAGHGVAPDLRAPERTRAELEQLPNMERHQWAAERMWEGLIGPSEVRWNAGAVELIDTPLASERILTDVSAVRRVNELAEQVHALGEQGLQAPGWDARAATYGMILATCATCHAAIPPPAE